MFVDFNYESLVEDFDKNGNFKFESILKLFENAGNRHSDIAHDANINNQAKTDVWILTDWYVVMDKIPTYGSHLTAKTWSIGATSTFGTTRDYELFADGKLCGRGSTKWVLMDTIKGRPVKVPLGLLDRYGIEIKKAFEDSKYPKIPETTEFINEISLKPRRSDIDLHNHVHNLTYIDYAMEALPMEVYNSFEPKTLRITYKKSILPEETVIVKYYYIEDSHCFLISNSEGEVKTQLLFK